MKLKPGKNSGQNRIRTHDLCDTGTVLYQLSYQANWELVTGIPTHDLCDTGAVLYQLSYKANWELVTGIPTHDFCDTGAVLYQLSYQANWGLYAQVMSSRSREINIHASRILMK